MQPTPELIDDLYRSKLDQARSMSPQQRLLAGPQIFDRVLRTMRDGIRFQYPEAAEEEVERILRDRLALARRLENRS